jgi:CTP:molybdopterin cytidylyltransferase MocA
MKLYIAGPMTGYAELNFPAFHAEAARLRAFGFEIVNPAEIDVGPNPDWLAAMRADIRELVTCDGIALLPGWEQSRGASVENTLARGLGLRVMQARHIVGLAGDMPVISQEAVIEILDDVESGASEQMASAA